jgi:3-hydroxymyristoyl/3-hydroxydecanoyl-(acyl carrier protein) dehydratase
VTWRSVVDALLDHPTVSAALRVDLFDGREALIVVPSSEGLGVYRHHGRTGLVARWAEHLGCQSPAMSMPTDWRLIEELPVTPGGSIDVVAAATLVLSALPRLPCVEEMTVDDEGRVHQDIRVPLEMAAFRGHFPAAPIVPGVEQIGWAVSFGRRHFPLGRFRGVDAAKFRRVLQPADALRLTLAWSESESTLRFSYTCDDRECSTGRVSFHARNV